MVTGDDGRAFHLIESTIFGCISSRYPFAWDNHWHLPILSSPFVKKSTVMTDSICLVPRDPTVSTIVTGLICLLRWHRSDIVPHQVLFSLGSLLFPLDDLYCGVWTFQGPGRRTFWEVDVLPFRTPTLSQDVCWDSETLCTRFVHSKFLPFTLWVDQNSVYYMTFHLEYCPFVRRHRRRRNKGGVKVVWGTEVVTTITVHISFQSKQKICL